MADPSEDSKFSFNDAKAPIKLFGIASAICLGIALLAPWPAIQALGLIGLAAAGFQFALAGLSAISFSLSGEERRVFQFAASIAVPTFLSLYFLKDSPSLDTDAILKYVFSVGTLLACALIAFVSWVGADQLDREHPFRGFMIASAIIFVICWFAHNGVYAEPNDYDEGTNLYIDNEAAKGAATTGRFFVQFAFYILVSYSAMIAKLLVTKLPTNAPKPYNKY